MFKTKSGNQELENVYIIALLIDDLEQKIQLYDTQDAFIILSFDANGVPTAATLQDLFHHYKTIKLQ
eukprot:15365651-Ditylum_brightwellii.AAC.2